MSDGRTATTPEPRPYPPNWPDSHDPTGPPSTDELLGEEGPGSTPRKRRKDGGYLLVEQPECEHTPRPKGYLEFIEFAREKSKTHRQERCPICGLWTIWVPKKATK